MLEESREIVFKTMLDSEVHHTVHLDGAGPADYRSVVAFFARQLLKELRLVGGYAVLYGKVKTFIRDYLFTPPPVDLEDPIVLRNLSESEVGKLLFDSFKVAMNALTIQESGTSVIEDRIRLRDTRPFRTENRRFVTAKNSIFSKIVGEARSDGFELTCAAFLRDAPDVQAFAKNYLGVGFKIDYVKADGDLSTYTRDFIARTVDGIVCLIETKGREELDLHQKMKRLGEWCTDATAARADDDGVVYRFVYVDQDGFEKHRPQTFAALETAVTDYQ